MTRAEQNKSNLKYDEAMQEAVDCADNYDNDYGNEMASFEWPDGSVSQFNGVSREIYTYGSRD